MNREIEATASRFTSLNCLFDFNQPCIKNDHQACNNCPVVRKLRLIGLKEARAKRNVSAKTKRRQNLGCASIFHVPIPPRELTRRHR